jgi:MYXO-CTERM domain-containing protein
MKRRGMAVVTWVTGLVLGGAGSDAASAEPLEYEVLQWFPAPMPSPDGLEWVGGSLYTTECTSEDVFELSPDGGGVVRQLTLPGAFIDHLAWDGAYLWGNDHHAAGKLHQVDIVTEEVVATIAVSFSPMGLTWDGSHLWSMSAGTGEVHRLDPVTGEIVRTLVAPGSNVCGIGWDGVCLWISDLSARLYYQVDPETGEVVATLAPPGGPNALFTGFTWDGSSIWVADENPRDPRIYQLAVALPETGPCAHPAGAGGSDPDVEADAGPEPVPDAGTTPGGDAEADAPGTDGAHGPGEQTGGCAVALAGTSDSWLPAGGLLALALVASRRRRSSRRPDKTVQASCATFSNRPGASAEAHRPVRSRQTVGGSEAWHD